MIRILTGFAPDLTSVPFDEAVLYLTDLDCDAWRALDGTCVYILIHEKRTLLVKQWPVGGEHGALPMTHDDENASRT